MNSIFRKSTSSARWLTALALLVSGSAGCLSRGSDPSPADVALRTLQTPARASQVVAVAVSPNATNIDSLVAWAAGGGASLGGIWIEGGEAGAVARFSGVVRAREGIPVLVGADMDEGLGRTISETTIFPPAWRALLTTDDELLERLGVALAEEARELGIGVGLVRGPPTMGGADYAGSDPALLPERMETLLASADDAGLAIVMGLFWSPRPQPEPVTWDLARLQSIELSVLAAAERAVALAPGWLSIPALTGDTTRLPHSASVYTALRDEHAWQRPIIVDLRPAEGDAAEQAVRAISAGADLVITSGDPGPVIRGIEAAVVSGEISVERLETAVRRVLELKFEMAPLPPTPSPAPPAPRMAAGEAENLAREIQARIGPTNVAPDSAADSDSARVRSYTLEVVEPDQVDMSELVLSEADAAIEAAIQDSTFTAAALAIGRRGGLVRFRGYHADDSQTPPVDPERTLFDIASLTKVVGTTTAAALLLDAGDLQLDAPVQRYVPEFRGEDKAAVTIWHLLTHTSGLPPGLWLYGSASSREQALSQVFEQPLRRPPGEQAEYSDLGLILLAEAVERAGGVPIDHLLASRAFTPLDMASTMFLPPLFFKDRIVPTALETERPFALHGVVHDGNAFRLGGVTGHAGLFSTARDLAIFSQMMLNQGSYGSAQILSPEIVDQLTTRQAGAEQRALGWDTPADRSSAGRFFSDASYGHTGYTGTSIWIDPRRDLFVVLLTNRTYTEASSGEMLDVRIDVHEAAVRAIVDEEITRRPGAR